MERSVNKSVYHSHVLHLQSGSSQASEAHVSAEGMEAGYALSRPSTDSRVITLTDLSRKTQSVGAAEA